MVSLQCYVIFCCTAKWISCMYVYIYLLFFGFLYHWGPYRALRRVPVLYNRFSLVISLYIGVYIHQSQSPSSSHSSFSLWYPCVFSLHLCLCFCFADRFTYINQLGFPGSSAGKESTCNAGDPGSIPGSGRSPGEGKGYPLQYSGLENSMDRPWGRKELDMTE